MVSGHHCFGRNRVVIRVELSGDLAILINLIKRSFSCERISETGEVEGFLVSERVESVKREEGLLAPLSGAKC